MRNLKHLFIIIIILVAAPSLNAQQWEYPGGNKAVFNYGNVGIGTATPAYPLTIAVNGTPWPSFGVTKNVRVFVNDGNQDGGGIAISDDGGFFDWNDGYVTYEPMCCGAGLRVRRSNFIVDNNIGIGTTNPTEKLTVNGTILSTKVKVVGVGNIPDYVFHASYRLRPLSEVEQYIKQYHHLPEVPSAEEVKTNGLDVGDHQAVLLKKIEELTLYVIEQNKKLEAQQQRLNALEKQLTNKP